ncbi:MAG: hypothetical protein RTU63_04345 [Candidatus Thorarchaeota archaeon]
MRGNIRKQSREMRRKRLRVVKGVMRIGLGSAILYLTVGTHRPIKILREDVETLEADSRKFIEEMAEEELMEYMMNQGIDSIPLTEDEKQMVSLASKYVLAGYFLLDSSEATS